MSQYFMNKTLSISKFQNNLDAELDYVCSNLKNKIIIKTSKCNLIVLSEEAFNSSLNKLSLVSSEANKKYKQFPE